MSPDIPLPASVTRPGKIRRYGIPVLAVTTGLLFGGAAPAAAEESPAHHPDRGGRTILIDLQCGADRTGGTFDLGDYPYSRYGSKPFWLGNSDRPDYLVEIHPGSKTVEIAGTPHSPHEQDKRAYLYSNGEKLVFTPKVNGVNVSGTCPPVDVAG